MERPDSRRAGLTLALLAAMAISVAAQQPVRHSMSGMVLTVDVSRKSVVISHDAVSGVMPAMTMPFEVRDVKELNGLVPGTIVSFTLVLTKEIGYIESVKAIRYQSVEQDPIAARRLRLLANLGVLSFRTEDPGPPVPPAGAEKEKP